MAPSVICFINQKGGCGKSSSCFQLSGYYAGRGLRVLLIDADPQGSLSQGFFGPVPVENLPAEQKRVVLLRFVEQKSIKEVASAICKTEGAVKQLQFRALSTLKARMEGANA